MTRRQRDYDYCSVCSNEIDENDFIRLECNHGYHRECITELMIKVGQTCPSCESCIDILYVGNKSVAVYVPSFIRDQMKNLENITIEKIELMENTDLMETVKKHNENLFGESIVKNIMSNEDCQNAIKTVIFQLMKDIKNHLLSQNPNPYNWYNTMINLSMIINEKNITFDVSLLLPSEPSL